MNTDHEIKRCRAGAALNTAVKENLINVCARPCSCWRTLLGRYLCRLRKKKNKKEQQIAGNKKHFPATSAFLKEILFIVTAI